VGNSLLDVVYPDQVTFAQIFDRYRPWIVGGFWLILTVLTLMVFQKLYRRRRSSSKDA
jgi:cellulose synthase operon protein B